MKKITLILTLAFLSSVVFQSCDKNNGLTPPQTTPTNPTSSISVEQKNMGLIFKFTGTNCYYCGDWGWTMFKDLTTQFHKKDAVCIAAYSQNTFAKLLISPIATDFDRKVPVSKGYPTFTGNFVDAWSGGNTFAGMNNVISTNVNNHKNAEVVANTGFKSTITGNEMSIETNTKFFKSAEGEYYLGVYLLEDGVVASQSGPNGGPNAIHDNVLRGGNSSWGELLTSGSIEANKNFEKTIKITLDPSWNSSKLSVFTILWKKNGANYDFVNAYIKG